MRLRGLHHLYALVCAGPSFFRAPTERLHWHRGGVLHVDTGAMLDGYIAELCRTAVLGAPSALAERMLAGCRALEAAVLPVLREGSRRARCSARGTSSCAAIPSVGTERSLRTGSGSCTTRTR